MSLFIKHKLSTTICFDSILQFLNLVKINFERDHGKTIFTSLVIQLDVFNLKML